MPRELKVYNRFDDLILHLRFVPGQLTPYQVIEGSTELREAVWGLYGQDFDRIVIVGREPRRFTAKWASPEYLDAMAGYWASNFGWRTETLTDEFPILLRDMGLVRSAPSVALGARTENRVGLECAFTNLSEIGLVPMPKTQGQTESDFGREAGMASLGGSQYGVAVGSPG
ncbi:MAG: hypothetical protein ACRECH_12625 [Nitrososphaerales archaeon]